jgi:hypothetical protein
MSVVLAIRPRVAFSWRAFETWVGTRRSAVTLFAVALAVFVIQSLVLPAYPGRDMGRYIQAFVQLASRDPVVPSVMNTRGPLSDLGVGIPLELGGWMAEAWLALLYAASIVAWSRVAYVFGARAAIGTSAVLLAYPGYGILFHGLASDALFAAAFASWAVLVSTAIVRPSVKTFLLVGFGLGLLVLVRPANQALIVFTLLPFLLRAPWSRRVPWAAAIFVASAVPTQAWKAFADRYYQIALGLEPSAAVLGTAVLLLPLLFPSPWRRRVAVIVAAVAVPTLVAVVAVRGVAVGSPTSYVRAAAQSPSGDVFMFRAFEMDRIMSPDNGPASREMGRVVQRELLSKEPYRSYGVDLHEFFSSGSDRIFGDFTSLGGVDFRAATSEAIHRHPGKFAAGIAKTIWHLLATRHVYADEPASGGATRGTGNTPSAIIVVNGRRLPRPSDGQPIPASRIGLGIGTIAGAAGEVWLSPSEHPLVFTSPVDKHRYSKFQDDTRRLTSRLPTRDAHPLLVHRLNQASHVFPTPVFWLLVGLGAFAFRRPRHALAALAPSIAALLVIVATGMVAFGVAEYAAPVSPAFVVMAAAGFLGAEPRGHIRLPGRRFSEPG